MIAGLCQAFGPKSSPCNYPNGRLRSQTAARKLTAARNFSLLAFMKSITAIVKPHVVPRLAEVLREMPQVIGVDIAEVKGYGRQKNYLNEYQGSEYSAAYIPKVLVEVRVNVDDLEDVLSAIIETTRTGRMGDGKIFILDCAGGVREEKSKGGEEGGKSSFPTPDISCSSS